MVHRAGSLYEYLIKKLQPSNGNLDEIRIISLYRYVSVAVTSLYYLIYETEAQLPLKLGVVISIMLAGNIISELYKKNYCNKVFLKLLIFTETLGISLVLFSTYGINSPFIWYALNPVLVAASFLPAYFSWSNLMICLTASFSISYVYFNFENDTLGIMLKKSTNTALVLVAITFAVQLMSGLIRRLRMQAQELQDERTELARTNAMLEHAQSRLENSIDHIMALYQAIEAFTSSDSLDRFCKVFADYGSRLTESDFSFFCPAQFKGDVGAIASNASEEYEYRELLLGLNKEIESIMENHMEIQEPTIVKICGHSIMVATIKSSARVYGLLGIKIDNGKLNHIELQCHRQLRFLSELCGIILERFHLEDAACKITLTEEQNRIANEIHDSVLQKMFSITCASHVMKCKWKGMDYNDIEEKLEMICEASNSAMSELRSVVYGLSTRKQNESLFILNIKKYLNEFSKLNGVIIEICIRGDEHLMSGSLKKALYRVICEACSNSVRHGNCTTLSVKLLINVDFTELEIKDNGNGFCAESLSEDRRGLGIYNMMKQIEGLEGKFSINGSIGKGTSILVTVPTMKKKEESGGMAI